MTTRYKLASGSQVRKEGFGLLFYTMSGPRLYFLPSGETLDTDFFEGRESIQLRLDRAQDAEKLSITKEKSLKAALMQLTEKGVIHEC